MDSRSFNGLERLPTPREAISGEVIYTTSEGDETGCLEVDNSQLVLRGLHEAIKYGGLSEDSAQAMLDQVYGPDKVKLTDYQSPELSLH